MESLAALFMLAVASNVDNTGVGLVYGIRNKRIPYGALWAVTIIGGIASGVAAEGSIWLKQWLPPFLESGIAGGILIAIGIRSWNFSSIRSLYYQALLEKEWWFLSVALSLNNIGLGLTGGLLGFHPVIFGLSIGLTSGIALWIGSRIGEKLGKTAWQQWINPLSSLLLIGMGIYQFLGW
ncbi:hypothetical protein GXN76_11170 [Kroppenstedtia pulmonis]|uniref:Sporulation membrane protein YtaF n=1 Tax=Kroppenstedtia pulmonis TaxID=1380685 RepID=A0A7D4BI05_9BACL|nr:manganese efflux pump [Kroppenstedtia pulmonis]QKG84975.1 hypothetical protein GXN76_11170 [Kroppenstedtia pulmonis]